MPLEILVQHHGRIETAQRLERLDMAGDFRRFRGAIIAVEVDAVSIAAQIFGQAVGIENGKDRRVELREKIRAGATFPAGRAVPRFRRRECRRKDKSWARPGRQARAAETRGAGRSRSARDAGWSNRPRVRLARHPWRRPRDQRVRSSATILRTTPGCPASKQGREGRTKFPN